MKPINPCNSVELKLYFSYISSKMFDYKLSSEFLKKCQVMYESDIKGNVSPWVLNEGIPAREDL
ncbi:MAG: hypothetical protein QW478_11735, partial [Candidatus Micrarchaeaceae archaeon]